LALRGRKTLKQLIWTYFGHFLATFRVFRDFSPF
jgi:hypothetical protein